MPSVKFKKRLRLRGFDYKGTYRYSLTFCTHGKRRHFTDASTIITITAFLQRAAEKYTFKVWTYCFMPDHLHVLIEGDDPGADMKKFAAAFKQQSGFWFRKTRNQDLWQINYYEHVLRSDEATSKVARYIMENPVRKGLAGNYTEYPYSMCRIFDFVGQGFSLVELQEKQATLKGSPANDKKNTAAGFTLIEIVIVIVIVGIIAGIAALIIVHGVRAYSDQQVRSDVHYQARVAMERMTREIRHIRSRADIAVMGDTDLRFTDMNGAPVGFSWLNPTLSRWNGAGSDVLASGIATFDFNYYRQDGVAAATAAEIWTVEITLTAQQGAESIQMRTRAHPRNF